MIWFCCLRVSSLCECCIACRFSPITLASSALVSGQVILSRVFRSHENRSSDRHSSCGSLTLKEEGFVATKRHERCGNGVRGMWARAKACLLETHRIIISQPLLLDQESAWDIRKLSKWNESQMNLKTVFWHFARCYPVGAYCMSEDDHLYTRRRENLKSHLNKMYFWRKSLCKNGIKCFTAVRNFSMG
jgi:hypothetical protein